MSVKKINYANFEEIKNSDNPVLLDFYADWCGPCKMLAPILHEISEENPDLIIAKINVDDSTSLAIQYGIQSIPKMLVMENGEIVNKPVGLRSKEQILDMLK